MAPGLRMPKLLFKKCGALPLPCWIVIFGGLRLLPLFGPCGKRNFRTFKGRSRDIFTLLSNIQRLAVMWAYTSLPLMAIPNLLLFSSFKDLLFLKHRRPFIQYVWTKPPEG
ncbi:hypothetical protein AMTRI_Chr13g116230 [Amborella trichopoda]